MSPERKDLFPHKEAVAAVILDSDGRVLLGQRINTRLGQGKWTIPGGHIEKGEKVFDAVQREVFEETSLKVEAKEYVSVVFGHLSKEPYYLIFGILAETERNQKLKNSDELVNLGFFSLDNLPKPLFGPAKLILSSFKTGKIRKLLNLRER